MGAERAVSIILLHLKQSSACIAVDTHSFTEGDGRHVGGHVLKLLILPHLQAVIACQGRTAFTELVFAQCCRPAGDFDHLLATMVERLEMAVTLLEHQVRSLSMAFDRKALCFSRFVAVGFVGETVVARNYLANDPCSATALEVEPLRPGSYMSPWIDGEPAPDLSDFAKMRAVARRQIRMPTQRHLPLSGSGSSGCGGQLIAASLTPHGITVNRLTEDIEADGALQQAPAARRAGWSGVLAGVR